MRATDAASDRAINKSVFEISATGMKDNLETSYHRSNFIAFLLTVVFAVFGILSITAVKKKHDAGFVSVRSPFTRQKLEDKHLNPHILQ